MDHDLDDQTQIIYEVIPGNNELAEINCYVDDKEVDCGDQPGVLSLPSLALGEHKVEIVAFDVKGLKGSADD